MTRTCILPCKVTLTAEFVDDERVTFAVGSTARGRDG